MAGFLLAAVPILTLGLGGVEAAHWSGLRQTLSLALMEAARAGATQQARPQAIAQAFEHGLRMAYPAPRAAARALQERRAALGGAPWRIRIARPTPEVFLDHADPDVRGPRAYPGQPLIRNDYQARQQTRRQAQGWPQGRGPRSGLNIHEANTLVLELWWPHRPLVPGVGAIVRSLAPLADDPAQARLMAAGYLPFRRRVTVAMQSHPAAWPDLADGRVTHGVSAPPGWAAGQTGRDGATSTNAAWAEAAMPDAGATEGPTLQADDLDSGESPDDNATDMAQETGAMTPPGPEAAACEPAP
ncbi:TadE/TadG family type IV pilus assembly protein [Castellaniella hirudinis]|uniref:TadE/TadG family type IV pilus assembly protein n=1 Tax=Castellaniella hirudinis TaxID=1144617 RepID=A0ABV8RZK3_9BURK